MRRLAKRSGTEVRIDVFFGVYPHPAKPYLEAQLIEWRRQGHALRLFSLGKIPDARSEFDITFIDTLRQRPVQLSCKVISRILTRPARRWRSERRIVPKVKRLATDTQLPSDTPDVLSMHNLATAVRFSHLKHAAPRTALAIYYRGGEIPGVRQIPFEASSQALRRADINFSDTEASVRNVVSRGAPADRTARIPVGVPLERFMPPDVALRAFVALRGRARIRRNSLRYPRDQRGAAASSLCGDRMTLNPHGGRAS